MLKKKHYKHQWEIATCDFCGGTLLQDDSPGKDTGIENANYGLLKNCFGWPSDIDACGSLKSEWHLCETCWKKLFELLGMNVYGDDSRKPTHSTFGPGPREGQ